MEAHLGESGQWQDEEIGRKFRTRNQRNQPGTVAFRNEAGDEVNAA